MSSPFLKDHIPSHEIQRYWFFLSAFDKMFSIPLPGFQMRNPLPDVPSENALFLSGCVQGFFLVFSFQKLNYDLPVCGFL